VQRPAGKTPCAKDLKSLLFLCSSGCSGGVGTRCRSSCGSFCRRFGHHPGVPKLPLLGCCRGELSEQIPANGRILREEGGTG